MVKGDVEVGEVPQRLQSVYRRYVEGHTKEARYAGFLDGVKGLAAVGLGAIRKGHIDALGTS